MSSKQQTAIRLMVATNLTQREIAKELDVREETISRWKRSDAFKEKMKAEQDKYLHELTAPAMRTIKELLNSHSDYVRLQSAQDILDRTGYKATDKLEAELTTTVDINLGDWSEDEN